jgi:hypothetical protein
MVLADDLNGNGDGHMDLVVSTMNGNSITPAYIT